MPKGIRKEKYIITLSSSDKSDTAKAASVYDALNVLSIGPTKVKSILRVEKGTKSAQLILYPFQVRRLFTNEIYKIVLDKRLNLLLK